MWAVEAMAVARKGQPAPPLLSGNAGHPCAVCGAYSRHEWSPGKYRSCSARHLLAQNPASYVQEEVRQRHKATLRALALHEEQQLGMPTSEVST